MPDDIHGDHRFARLSRVNLLVITVVATVFFASGFYTSRLLDETRVSDQAEKQFKEFLSFGMDLGFVTVDQGKLAELECIISEADWTEDEDAERQEGVKP
jgi:hypothetical protein